MNPKKNIRKNANRIRLIRHSRSREHYLQLRYQNTDESLECEGEEIDLEDDLFICCDRCTRSLVYGDYSDAVDIAIYPVYSLIHQRSAPTLLQTLLTQENILSSEVDREALLPSPTEIKEYPVYENLEEILALHRNREYQTEVLKELQAMPEEVDFLANLLDSFRESTYTIVYIAYLAPFWIRKPSTWNPSEKNIRSLIDHVFVKYTVSPVLYTEWEGLSNDDRVQWIYWFIILGQGGSLYRAAPYFNWKVPKKFQHHFLQAPTHLSPEEASFYAEVTGLGGTYREYIILSENRAFRIDPITSYSETNQQFWRETLQWLIQHRDAITDDQARMALQWATHQRTERERVNATPFSWKGRSVARVLQAVAQYQQEISRPYSKANWKSWGWDWTPAESDGWVFVELTTGEQLYREGQAMSHCVNTYAQNCISGQSDIVSLRFRTERRITIEIHPRTKHIVQARGRFNRLPVPNEQKIIDMWFSQVVKSNTTPSSNK